jgi:hypothetical protein
MFLRGTQITRTRHDPIEKQLVELIGIPRARIRLFPNARHRFRIEPRQIGRPVGKDVAKRDGARPSLLERCVIQKGVRPGIENLVCEGRGLDRVAELHPDLAAFDPFEKGEEAGEVRRLVKAVPNRLADQGVVRNLDRARYVLLTGNLVRKDRSEQIVRLHPLEGKGNPPAAPAPEDGEGARGIPPPARREHRRGQERLRQEILRGPGSNETQNRLEREGLRRSQREHDRVIGRGSLQLHVEGPAQALTEREPEAPVDACPNRRVQDELHSTRLVEEPLDQDLLSRGDHAGGLLLSTDVAHKLLRTFRGEPALGLEPGRDRLGFSIQSLCEFRAQGRDLIRKLGGARGCLPHPEWNVGRGSLGIDDADDAVFDAADPPAVGPEQEDVAGKALDGEVLVDRPDDRPLGLEDHRVLAGVGNRPARREGCKPGAAAGAQPLVDPIPMQVDATPSARSLETPSKHLEDRLIGLEVEIPVGKRATHPCVELGDALLPGRALRNDLLGQHIDRGLRNGDSVEASGAHRANQGGTLHQLVPGRREETSPGTESEGVAGSADPLQECGDAARRPDLTDELHRADVDSQLQRGRRNQRPQLAGSEKLFDP